jgi:hypothetical protein
MLYWKEIREVISAKAVATLNKFLSAVAAHNHDTAYSPLHQYLALTKSGAQTVSTIDETVVSFDGAAAVGGTSLLVRNGDTLKALANCYLRITCFVGGANLDQNKFVKFRIRKNGSELRRAINHRGGDSSSAWGGQVSSMVTEMSVNDYIDVSVDSDDTSYTVSGGYTFLEGDAWAR